MEPTNSNNRLISELNALFRICFPFALPAKHFRDVYTKGLFFPTPTNRLKVLIQSNFWLLNHSSF